jgi:hypothetical protein
MKQFCMRLLSLALLALTARAQAQHSDLIAQRDAAGLFINHQVAPKENFYSIGRLFNISPKVIAPFNGLTLEGGLTIGQIIKIPLKDQNFTSTKTVVAGEVLVPVYRMDGSKKVVAGFLKVVKGQSPLAVGGPAVSAPAAGVAVTASVKTTGGAAPVAKAPVANAPSPGSGTVSGAASPGTVSGAAGSGTVAPTAGSGTVSGAAGSAGGDLLSGPTNTTPAPKKKPVKKPVVTKPVDTPAVATDASATAPAVISPAPAPMDAPVSSGNHYRGEGFFHPDYLSQTDNGRKARNANGLAGVFKSTSGWDNGKFYALMNNVERGTVVKVTNLTNNKVVFVKVLGDIADIKQNTGIVIVLSDAAVGQLGAATDRFTAELSYAK